MIRLFSCDGREVRFSSSVESACADNQQQRLIHPILEQLQRQPQQQQRQAEDADDSLTERRESELFVTSASAGVSVVGPEVQIPKESLAAECELVDRIWKATSAAVSETDDFLFEQPSSSGGSPTKSSASAEEEEGSFAAAALDLRGLACATVEALSVLAVWVLSRIQDPASVAENVLLHQQKSKSSPSKPKKRKREFAPISIAASTESNSAGATGAGASSQQQEQQQPAALTLQDLNRRGPRRQEQVLVPPPDDEFPSRVSFDLESTFLGTAGKPARAFCLWLVRHFSWPQISQAHCLANFVGCRSLSETLAQLIALHLRQVSANPTSGTIVATVAMDAATRVGSNGGTVPAAAVSPAIAVESMKRSAEEKIEASLASHHSTHGAPPAAAAAAASSSASSSSTTKSNDPANLITPLQTKLRSDIERTFFESSLFLRKELAPAACAGEKKNGQ